MVPSRARDPHELKATDYPVALPTNNVTPGSKPRDDRFKSHLSSVVLITSGASDTPVVPTPAMVPVMPVVPTPRLPTVRLPTPVLVPVMPAVRAPIPTVVPPMVDVTLDVPDVMLDLLCRRSRWCLCCGWRICGGAAAGGLAAGGVCA